MKRQWGGVEKCRVCPYSVRCGLSISSKSSSGEMDEEAAGADAGVGVEVGTAAESAMADAATSALGAAATGTSSSSAGREEEVAADAGVDLGTGGSGNVEAAVRETTGSGRFCGVRAAVAAFSEGDALSCCLFVMRSTAGCAPSTSATTAEAALERRDCAFTAAEAAPRKGHVPPEDEADAPEKGQLAPEEEEEDEGIAAATGEEEAAAEDEASEGSAWGQRADAAENRAKGHLDASADLGAAAVVAAAPQVALRTVWYMRPITSLIDGAFASRSFNSSRRPDSI